MNEELIEKYITGKLSDKETEEFEQKLKSDADLKTSLKKMREEILGIESHFLRQELASINTDPLISKPKSGKSIRTVGAILLGLALIIFLAWMILFRVGKTNNTISQDPIAQFSPDPGLPVTMGKTEDYRFMDGMVDFKEGKYELAIQKWEALRNSGTTSDTIEFYLANAFQAVDRTEEASTIYRSLLLNDASIFSDKARYYLALIYLKKDNPEEAKELLEDSNFLPAKNLLEQLN